MQQNLERERKHKQEFQDFILKKELQQNALNQELSIMSENMINQRKIETQFKERDAVATSVPFRELKKRKTDQILLEVRNKKLAELAQYKNRSPDRKYNDIQKLLEMMSDVGMKVPSIQKGKESGH